MSTRTRMALGMSAASLLLATVALAEGSAADPEVIAAAGRVPQNPALRLVAKFPIPQMTGTWDHLAGDAQSGRLFLTAQDEHAIDVLDVKSGKLLHRISGGFNRPQGQYFIPQFKRLVTSNGRDGTVRFTNRARFRLSTRPAVRSSTRSQPTTGRLRWRSKKRVLACTWRSPH